MATKTQTPITRRAMLRALGLTGAAALVAACSQPAAQPAAPAPKATNAPAAAPTSAAPAQASQPTAPPVVSTAGEAEWDKLVAAARQEKTVSVATYAGSGYRKVVEAFQEAIPGISVEHQQFQSSSRDFVPRLLQELKAGLYTWDVATMPTQEMLRQVRQAGGIDPIRPAIIRPDVLNDRGWLDSFEGGFNDTEKRWGYAIARYREAQLWVNTDVVKEGEIKSVKDLLDPKWKGKILAGDPRTKGSGFLPATAMRIKTGGDDIIGQLFRDQEAVLSTDARQLTEFMVRGRYPIGYGALDRVILADFVAEGLGKNLKVNPVPEIDYMNAGANMIWLLAKAPHPNAAQVFINWMLTQEGGRVYSTNIAVNSRRSDVPVVDDEAVPLSGVDYVRIDKEELLDEIQRTQDIAKAVLN